MPTKAELKAAENELRSKLRQLEKFTGREGERDRNAERMREVRAANKDVPVGVCEDKERRALLESDDIEWLMYYFAPESQCRSPFTYQFTQQQQDMIEAIRKAITEGGDQALAASRGEGKTTLFERMLLKYTLQGVIKFSVLFAATGAAAENSLESIKGEIETNVRLRADYPEACDPVIALENTPNRAHYQTVSGRKHDDDTEYANVPSRFSWCGQEIVLPNVPGSPSAGAIIATRGLDSAVRGLKKKGLRVDVAGIDDPDTEETARSAEQAKKLEDRIDRAIAGLGSQQRRVSRVMLSTIQNRTCASYRFTDIQSKPSWHGRRFRFLVKPPDRLDLWQEYVQFKRDDWRVSVDGFESTAANEFYVANREAMDAGAIVANPNRYTHGELSALQFYYNEVARIGQEAVSTEYDNDPPDIGESSGILSRDQIAAKANGYERGIVPRDAFKVTAFVDVQGRLLYWCVVAWRQDFTGYVLDYGAWPKQTRTYFTLRDAVPCIQDLYKGGGQEAECTAALKALIGDICGRSYNVDGGGYMQVNKCLIDSGWSADTVKQFCHQSPHKGILFPSKGYGIKASSKEMSTWKKEPGQQAGRGWVEKRDPKYQIRMAHYDANTWKTFMHARLSVPMGGPGCLSLYKALPSYHEMLADHIHAEYPVRVMVKGSTVEVDEWQKKLSDQDNHLLDCLVGNCVAASMLGAALPSDAPSKRPNAKPRTVNKMATRDGRPFFITNR
jgi:hypothetical protein